tara:strand:- start:1 stop:189 length:189 start_codon:yes stop_codon:yes gene_type:complete
MGGNNKTKEAIKAWPTGRIVNINEKKMMATEKLKRIGCVLKRNILGPKTFIKGVAKYSDPGG